MSNIMAAYNPDVLSCLANLSNDEVFTPPEIANKMLDMLPQELFKSPDTKFLDPACKSGVFLREIAKRLLEGLMPGYKDWLERIDDKKRENEELDDEEKEFLEQLQATVDHIFKEQLYGIAITELTSLLARRSLYCSKYPNSDYSVTKFDNPSGNIRFVNKQHRFKDGKCVFCGVAKKEGTYEREKMEVHAYEYIHTIKPEEIFGMKFDVVISNPPYQLNVGVEKENYAIPIYQKFIEQAKKLKPRFISMIVPARWYTGGRGLDAFRESMLSDKHIRKIVDYPNPYDCFNGVDIAGGICYFLWDRENIGDCQFTSIIGNDQHTTQRNLDEYPIFIRDVIGLNVIKKIEQLKINSGKTLDKVVSSQTPFGIITSYKPTDYGTPCWFRQKVGLKKVETKDVKDLFNCLDKFKLLIPEAPIAGQTDFTKPVGLYYEGNTLIANPGECCTQTWLVANSFNTKEETDYFRSYLLTKIVRFLILQTVVSQHVSREKFCFVPDLGKYDRLYTDEYLIKEWGITSDEWEYINSRIHNYGGDDNG